MNTMTLSFLGVQTRLSESYDRLTGLLQCSLDANARLFDARAALVRTRESILRTTDAKSLGANEAQREAALTGLLLEETARVHQAEKLANRLRGEIEIARLHVDEARTQLRLLEVQTSAVRELRELELSGL